MTTNLTLGPGSNSLIQMLVFSLYELSLPNDLSSSEMSDHELLAC